MGQAFLWLKPGSTTLLAWAWSSAILPSSRTRQVHPLSSMATVSIHREQVMVSGVQPTANHRRQLLEGLFVSSQNPQSNPTHLLSETINSKLQLTIDERRHPLMSRGLPALVFGWQLSRYVGTHSALWPPQ